MPIAVHNSSGEHFDSVIRLTSNPACRVNLSRATSPDMAVSRNLRLWSVNVLNVNFPASSYLIIQCDQARFPTTIFSSNFVSKDSQSLFIPLSSANTSLQFDPPLHTHFSTNTGEMNFSIVNQDGTTLTFDNIYLHFRSP